MMHLKLGRLSSPLSRLSPAFLTALTGWLSGLSGVQAFQRIQAVQDGSGSVKDSKWGFLDIFMLSLLFHFVMKPSKNNLIFSLSKQSGA